MTMTIRTVSGLLQSSTLTSRFNYLSLKGEVGRATFGFDRYLNQRFYTSREWRRVRDFVITRDNGCDLGVPGYEIHSKLLIHHMNPMTPKQITDFDESVLDPEYLITTTHRTHNAIHFGNVQLLPKPFAERSRGDTRLW
jgi:hypothetical protein